MRLQGEGRLMIRGKKTFAFGLAVLGFLALQAHAEDPYSGVAPMAKLVERGTQLQIGRYTVVPSKPSETVIDPLLVMAKLTFPRQTVVTIGDAITYVLLRTGYRLTDESVLTGSEKRFLALPLPENQRAIGPYKVRDILDVLLGQSWTLTIDPRNRIVGFISAPGFDTVEEVKARNDVIAQQEATALQAAKAAEEEKLAQLRETCSSWWHKAFDNACNPVNSTKLD